MRRNLGDVACWVFDLDNTLYPATSTVYPEVEARMNEFIMAELKLDLASAHRAAHDTSSRRTARPCAAS